MFGQIELPVWTESDELRRFAAGYLAMLPIRKHSAAIDQRFIEYVLALTDGVTGRIIDLLRRAAVRQSTLAQRRHNQESTERQYALRDKALALRSPSGAGPSRRYRGFAFLRCLRHRGSRRHSQHGHDRVR